MQSEELVALALLSVSEGRREAGVWRCVLKAKSGSQCVLHVLVPVYSDILVRPLAPLKVAGGTATTV